MNRIQLEDILSDLPLGGIRYFDSVGSTNELAARWAQAGAAHLSLIVADEQTSGRGRQGRRWFTARGSALAFSLILRQVPTENTAHLTALGALAVCETLNSALNPVLPAQIKWPNDVVATRRKLAGVLVEARWQGGQLSDAILGVGVNVSTDSLPPESELNFPATCVQEVVSAPVDRWELLKAILGVTLELLPQAGSADFLRAWEHRLAFRGEQVRVLQDGGEVISGRLIGLTPIGALRLRNEHGEEIHAGGGELQLRPVDKTQK
jgi:BirA family biotin operon repressor/biotin-[acetyl-CoA-carboxylase] ligase